MQGGDEVAVALREHGVGRRVRVVLSPEVVTELVTETEVSESTRFLCDRQRVTGCVGVEKSNPTGIKVVSQERGSVGSVPQGSCRALHSFKVAEESSWFPHIIYGSCFYAELGDLHRYPGVTVALVSLSNHLINEAGNVRGGRRKLRGEVEHDKHSSTF